MIFPTKKYHLYFQLKRILPSLPNQRFVLSLQKELITIEKNWGDMYINTKNVLKTLNLHYPKSFLWPLQALVMMKTCGIERSAGRNDKIQPFGRL